jgi:Tfp pilus assembly protein PilO
MTARDRLVVIVIVAIGILAGCWFLLIAPKNKEAGDLNGEVTAQQAALQSARSKVQSNTQARTAYYHDYATVANLGKAVPTSAQVEGLMIQLNTAAKLNHIDFREIDAGSSSLGPTPAPPVAATNAVGTANNASANAAGTTPTTPTTAPVSAASTTGLAPGSTVGGGLSTMPFTLKFWGNYFHLAKFLQDVQNYTGVRGDHVDATGRLIVIGTMKITPKVGNAKVGAKNLALVEADIQMTAYERPDDLQPAGAAAPGASTVGATSGTTAAAASTTPSSAPAAPAPSATAGIGATP